MDIDYIKLTLNQTSIDVLKVIITFMMFSVALELKPRDFKSVLTYRKPLYLGLFLFYIAAPFLTLILIHILNLRTSFALGLIMLTVCPTGNMANIMSMLGKANTALTVGLTSLINLLSLVTMPIMMSLMTKYSPATAKINTELSLNPNEIFSSVVILLGLPISLGMICNHFAPKLTIKIHKHSKKFSTIFLFVFILLGLAANYKHFFVYFSSIFYLTLIAILSSVVITVIFSKLIGLSTPDSKSLIFFSCHKNSAIGLSLSLQYFQTLGGMSLFLAFASIAQIFLGLTLTKILNINKIKNFLGSN